MDKLNWHPTGPAWTPAVRAPFDWVPPHDAEPDRVDLSQPERVGLAESAEGSKLSGGGLTVSASGPADPWLRPVLDLLEALQQSRWSLALRLAGAEERQLAASVKLLRRMKVRLLSYSLVAELESLELARVTVGEETAAGGERWIRQATFVVIRKGCSWTLAGLEGAHPRRTALARQGQWSLLAGRPAERILDQGLSGLCYLLAELWTDPRASFWGWAPRIPGLPVGLLGAAPAASRLGALFRMQAEASPTRAWSRWAAPAPPASPERNANR